MSFNIVLKKCVSENNRLVKEFVSNDEITLTGVMRAESSILNPIMRIETNSVITDYNYAVIDEFDRQYFITDLKIIAHNYDETNLVNRYLWEMSLHCDVLSTYASGLSNCRGIVQRQEDLSKCNLYINDGVFWTTQRKAISYKNFPNEFPAGDFGYVLITAAN